MARVDRLDQHIADLQEKIEQAKNHPAVQKMLRLEEKLDEARRVNEDLLANEEDVPAITYNRPPRRKPAKIPTLQNGGMPITSVPAAEVDPTVEEASE